MHSCAVGVFAINGMPRLVLIQTLGQPLKLATSVSNVNTVTNITTGLASQLSLYLTNKKHAMLVTPSPPSPINKLECLKLKLVPYHTITYPMIP